MSILHRMSLLVACLTLLWLTGCNKTPKRETVFGSLQSASDKPMGSSEVTLRPAVKAMETNEWGMRTESGLTAAERGLIKFSNDGGQGRS